MARQTNALSSRYSQEAKAVPPREQKCDARTAADACADSCSWRFSPGSANVPAGQAAHSVVALAPVE